MKEYSESNIVTRAAMLEYLEIAQTIANALAQGLGDPADYDDLVESLANIKDMLIEYDPSCL